MVKSPACRACRRGVLMFDVVDRLKDEKNCVLLSCFSGKLAAVATAL